MIAPCRHAFAGRLAVHGIVGLEECLARRPSRRSSGFACEVGRSTAARGRSATCRDRRGRRPAARRLQRRSARRSSATRRRLFRGTARRPPHESSETTQSRPSGSRSSLERSTHDAGFPFRRFTADTRMRGSRVTHSRGARAPGRARLSRSCGSRGALDRVRDEQRHGVRRTVEDRSRRACRVLERDAFMITWANPAVAAARGSAAQIAGALRAVRPQLRGGRSLGVSPAADVLGIVRAPAGFPGRSASAPCGAGGRAGLVEGARRGLRRPGGRREARAARAGTRLRPVRRGIVSFEDHIPYYADHDRARGGVSRRERRAYAGRVDPAARGRLAGRGSPRSATRRSGGLDRVRGRRDSPDVASSASR